MTLTVTIVENATGTTENQEVADNDYFLICTGSCYEAGIQVYPKAGTHVITIKGQRARHVKAPNE